jgi:S-DNA-T family DNA segregation ATPase FtsK/SpoIIIE
LYDEVKEAVIEAGKVSTSWIQRKCRIGYSRSARLMDILEETGVIGPADGAEPREVLIYENEKLHRRNFANCWGGFIYI